MTVLTRFSIHKFVDTVEDTYSIQIVAKAFQALDYSLSIVSVSGLK
jgi:hypothetical protein